METQAGVSLGNTDGWVDSEDLYEVSRGFAAEVARPGIVGSELSLKTLPRDERRFPEMAHPKSEPGIEVDGERRSLQLADRSKVHRDGRMRDLCEEALTQEKL